MEQMGSSENKAPAAYMKLQQLWRSGQSKAIPVHYRTGFALQLRYPYPRNQALENYGLLVSQIATAMHRSQGIIIPFPHKQS